MKINEFYPGIEKSGQKKLDQADRRPAQGADQADQVGRRSDQVQVSSIGREVQYYLEIARGIPDVREDRVEALQKKFQSGRYQVDPQRLARKIVEQGDLGDFLL
jgi:negative regulator of flagellin synthesis FlgM